MEELDVTYTSIFMKVWNDITQFVNPVYALLLAAGLYLFIKHSQSIGEFLKNLLFAIINKKQFKHKTKKDLTNHQIFNDLKYWNEYSVDKCFSNGDPVKLKIAKEMLKINFSTTYDWLQQVLDNIEIIIQGNTHRMMCQQFEKLSAIQWSEYKKRGIPDAFLRKFSDINAVAKTFIQDRMRDLLADDSSLDIFDRLYLIVGSLDTYYGTLLTDLPRTVQALNGDLRGYEFDGEVIGGPDTAKCFLPPNINYKVPATNRLNELINICKCARASVYAFHDSVTDSVLDGQYSCVYEAVSPGVSSVLSESTYQPANLLHTLFDVESESSLILYTKDAPSNLASKLYHKGVQVTMAHGLYIGDKLVGFVALSWLNESILDVIDIEMVKNKLEEYSFKLNHFVDYSFEQANPGV